MKHIFCFFLCATLPLSATGFSFSKENKIRTDNKDIIYCSGDIAKKTPTICYDKVISKRLNINNFSGGLSIQPLTADYLTELNKSTEKVKVTFKKLQGIRIDDPNFKANVSMTGIFQDINELKKSHDNIIRALNNIDERLKEIDALYEKAKLLNDEYASIDPVFKELLSTRLANYTVRFINDAAAFKESQIKPMEEAELLFEKYNKLAETYNNKNIIEQEKIRKFATDNGLLGYEPDFSNLLNGPEKAEGYVNFIIAAPKGIIFNYDIMLPKRPGLTGYSSGKSPVSIYIDYENTGRSGSYGLDNKYFKVIRINRFESATGESGYSVDLENIFIDKNRL
ncbi:MAG TPA: hypothetical protein VFW49_04845 [Fluviicoccus sp.]|nr:hypothetical protein [Fluviicoccus sp.]